MRWISVVMAVVIMTGFYGCVLMPDGTSMRGTSARVTIANPGARVNLMFSERDRNYVHRYYETLRNHRRPQEPIRRNYLPPGLQTHIHRNGRLPPGVNMRYLPQDLERQLTRLPQGYVRIQVGTDILLMNSSTRLIVDMMTGVRF